MQNWVEYQISQSPLKIVVTLFIFKNLRVTQGAQLLRGAVNRLRSGKNPQDLLFGPLKSWLERERTRVKSTQAMASSRMLMKVKGKCREVRLSWESAGLRWLKNCVWWFDWIIVRAGALFFVRSRSRCSFSGTIRHSLRILCKQEPEIDVRRNSGCGRHNHFNQIQNHSRLIPKSMPFITVNINNTLASVCSINVHHVR